MQIWEFVRELAFFFPLSGNDEHKNRIFDSYVENLEGICISNKCEYDWKKVLQTIQRTYTYQKFPPLADIIKVLPECKIFKPYQECTNEGALVVITLPNGVRYDFTISAIGRSLDSIKGEIKDKYGDCEIKTYPKGTVIIGDKVFTP